MVARRGGMGGFSRADEGADLFSGDYAQRVVGFEEVERR